MASGARIRITKLHNDRIGEQLERPMRNLGNAVGRRMQRLVPKRSWRLHDSIEAPEVKTLGDRVVVSIRFGGKVVSGVFVGYHMMVEQGTSKMRAQPYARPALYQSRTSDLRSTTVMAGKHGTKAERAAWRRAARASARREHEAES